MESVDERFASLENATRTGYLIGGFITHSLSIAEREELDAWVLADERNMELFDEMTSENKVNEFLAWLSSRDTEAKLREVKSRLIFKQKKRRTPWNYYLAAACTIGIAVWLWLPKQPDSSSDLTNVPTVNDILPGGEAAELHLSSGRVIQLDGLSDTTIEGIRIRNGEIAYSSKALDPTVHEIRIPAKGFFKAALPDGTAVWLNAYSSIRFPAVLSGNERMVSVTGEVFFAVAQNKNQSFLVQMDHVLLRALGTEFNVNTFDRTVTLVEGSVRVTQQQSTRILKVGEQLQTDDWLVTRPELASVVAWTKNQFRFKDATIEEVMRPIGRWYDARVVYEDKIDFHFNGTIERNVPVSKVLELLEETGNVRFEISGDSIIVKK